MQQITAPNTEHQTNLTVIISEKALAEISVIKLTPIHITYYTHIHTHTHTNTHTHTHIYIYICCKITFFVGPTGVVIRVASLKHQISKCSPTLSVVFFNLYI